MEIEDESYPLEKNASNPKLLKAIDPKVSVWAKWQSMLVEASITLAAVAAIAGTGFAFGRHVDEAKTHETVAKIQSENVVKSAELEKSKADNANLSSAYRGQQEQLAQKEAQIAQLTDAVVRGRNCNFWRQQIETAQRDLSREQRPMAMEFGRPASAQRDQETIDRLEARLSDFSKQLGTCIKGGT
jgi:hypothetical protein